MSRVHYINGDFYHPPTHCTWEKMKQITVKVNNIVVGPIIENSKDAYFHTRKALHLSDSEPMFVPYEHYKDGNAFVVYELNPTEDSNLKVLPKEMKKTIDVEILFDTMDGVEIYVKMIGLMNQVCKFSTMKTTFKELAI